MKYNIHALTAMIVEKDKSFLNVHEIQPNGDEIIVSYDVISVKTTTIKLSDYRKELLDFTIDKVLDE